MRVYIPCLALRGYSSARMEPQPGTGKLAAYLARHTAGAEEEAIWLYRIRSRALGAVGSLVEQLSRTTFGTCGAAPPRAWSGLGSSSPVAG
jgi:hypothetical protein